MKCCVKDSIAERKYRVMQKVFVKMASRFFGGRGGFTVGQNLDYGFHIDKLTHVRSSCIKYKSWPSANYDVISITM